MKSIGLIIPYFLNGKGAWPTYIDWHLASCRANSTIDFYIFTDDHSISRWEDTPNIHITYMTFSECIELMHKTLGDVLIDKPYKFCDFKPSYGTIFYDWIKDKDYWGFYDCDLLFGDLRWFFTDEILEKYDSFLILGHLQIFRNSPETNNYFRLERPKDSKYPHQTWEDVRTHYEYRGYDEWSGVPQLIREHGKKILWERKVFSNIYEPQKYKHVFDKNVGVNRPFQVWQWKDGGIYLVDMLTKKKRQRLYIHLTQRKMKHSEYNDEKEIYITQKSEFKPTVTFADSITGFEYIKLMTKKTLIWIHWQLTHLKGKQNWEM